MTDHSSIFESFNARSLRPAQVAQRFVPPSQFGRLTKRRHSLVIGPRGSGKTTLLKMLQQPALEQWDHDQAAEILKRIDYSSVFVAADVLWSAQLRTLGEDRLDTTTRRLLAISAFTTHVLRALITTMIQRAHGTGKEPLRVVGRVQLSSEGEGRVAAEIADTLHLKPRLRTLRSIRTSLSGRLSEIRQLGGRLSLLPKEDRQSELYTRPELHLAFVQAAGACVDAFEAEIQDTPGSWALCFDELELAPQWIRDELVRSIRSTDERFLFKLAMSPFDEEIDQLESAFPPSPGHDFDPIELWYNDRRDTYRFCEKLWYSMLDERGWEKRPPREVLGGSYFDAPSGYWRQVGSAYSADSKWGRRFASLAEKDSTFRHYLEKKDIDVRRLGELPADRRAADVRKIAPLLPVREFFRAADAEYSKGRKRTRRSRKSRALYAGASSLFMGTEGNPRLFIGLFDRLLSTAGEPSRISKAVQGRELYKASQRFAAMLGTIPAESGSGGGLPRGILTLVRKVGNHFHSQVVEADFVAEPPLSFIVDSDLDASQLRTVGQALNAGAIVYIPDATGQVLLGSPRGKRFRLAYLLAPLYGLPIRKGRALSLRKILSAASDPEQLELT